MRLDRELQTLGVERYEQKNANSANAGKPERNSRGASVKATTINDHPLLMGRVLARANGGVERRSWLRLLLCGARTLWTRVKSRRSRHDHPKVAALPRSWMS